MKPFLQNLAEEIAARYAADPGKLCVVLPNRRAGLYLKKYLARALNKTAWAPQTYSVEDFITQLSGLPIIDPAGLLFEFYQVHKEIHGANAQDFDLFSDWAEVLLQDFEEIDQYLIDPEKIFSYLNAARALSVWNLNERPLTEQESSYIAFYNSFLQYYQHLHKKLTGKKQVYQGLAYRLVAENISEIADGLKWEKIFFAGLNALSLAEEKIMEALLLKGKAEVFWDADDYYIRDDKQEAGEFLRKHLAKWPVSGQKWVETNFLKMNKQIRVFGIPGSLGQAQKAGEIIGKFKEEWDAPDKTALVLADEKLLLPVLYSLPDGTGPVNVTMGYPFRYTHLYQLAGLLFQMHENAEKMAAQRQSATRAFYVNDLLKVVAHPYIQLFEPDLGSGQLSFTSISESIRLKNRVFMQPAELLRYSQGTNDSFRQLNECIFSNWDSPSAAMDGLIRITEMLRDRMIREKTNPQSQVETDLEYLFHFAKIIRRCRTMMEAYPVITTLKTLRKILFQLLDSSRLPFSGEPLQGLQVMGVLETRAIDFENIVILSVNEGILPSGRMPNSFIPFDIKRLFGLPTFQHKDAVFGYHFYRMLQRAGNIYILYDTEGDMMKGGEKSRFITQIGYELRKYNPGVFFEEKLLSPAPPETGNNTAIVKTKTPAVMEKLVSRAAGGFSPTTLNLYIKCPLQFYFQEILGLSEAETIEETVEAKTMGTAVHQVLQKVYSPFSGKYVDPVMLENRLKDTEKLLLEAYSEHYREGDLGHGKNHLIFKASHFLVNQLILKDISDSKASPNPSGILKIISLETPFSHVITCKIKDKAMDVRIKGKTDRIDQLEDTIRIIDYKTGSVKASELKIPAWENLISDPKISKAFQLLLYAYLYFRNQKIPGQNIQSGNITLRRVSEGFMKVSLPEGQEIGTESMDIFEGKLKELCETILDEEIPFTQTEDAENCVYCPFKAICTR